jgi:uncharacterized protein DUF4145
MKCPHCTIYFHDNWVVQEFVRSNSTVATVRNHRTPEFWRYRSAACPNCGDVTIEIARFRRDDVSKDLLGTEFVQAVDWRQVYPIGASRGPVPPEVPKKIAEDYVEACNVLPLSPKASAALSRRCLQNVLHAHGYRARDLAKEIDLLLAEADPRKVLPGRLRETVDSIRNFGNFSAHPIDDRTTLQVIDVEPHEAEWCLEIIEDLFEHFYVGPVVAKLKKAALDAKLTAAGKPPSK